MWVGLFHPPRPVQVSPENDISRGCAGNEHDQETSLAMVMVATTSCPMAGLQQDPWATMVLPPVMALAGQR